jgi:hypothetical protein
MFGFFTYEFRVGHFRDAKTQEMAWSTAQGRFGRPLRAPGVQHPAPTLNCLVNRDEEKLYVSAPYATAVFGGKNVTADPRLKYDVRQRDILKRINIRNWKDEVDYANSRRLLKLAGNEKSNKDATKYGTVVWSNQEVAQLLKLYGLPAASPLSVLVVEILPTITNFDQHVPGFGQEELMDSVRSLRDGGKGFALPGQTVFVGRAATRQDAQAVVQEGPSPVSDALGHHRILRTSPLAEVPFVCCTDC